MRHVLYVDDEELLVTIFTRLLERRGVRVSAFSDQHAALAAFRADPAAFDIVLTDHQMPGMTGLDLAREVLRIRPDVTVALISGDIEVVREAAREAGIQRLIHKAAPSAAVLDQVLAPG